MISSPLVAIHADETLDDAVKIMSEHHTYHVPVIDDRGRIVDMVVPSDRGRRMTTASSGSSRGRRRFGGIVGEGRRSCERSLITVDRTAVIAQLML